MPVASLLRVLELYRLPFPPFMDGLFLRAWGHGRWGYVLGWRGDARYYIRNIIDPRNLIILELCCSRTVCLLRSGYIFRWDGDIYSHSVYDA